MQCGTKERVAQLRTDPPPHKNEKSNLSDTSLAKGKDPPKPTCNSLDAR
jgi:hypothetical protein